MHGAERDLHFQIAKRPVSVYVKGLITRWLENKSEHLTSLQSHQLSQELFSSKRNRRRRKTASYSYRSIFLPYSKAKKAASSDETNSTTPISVSSSRLTSGLRRGLHLELGHGGGSAGGGADAAGTAARFPRHHGHLGSLGRRRPLPASRSRPPAGPSETTQRHGEMVLDGDTARLGRMETRRDGASLRQREIGA